jgi:integrase
MASKYQRVKRFPGVYCYESQKSKNRGKADKCFFIRYQDAYGKQQWEKVGWSSENYTAQFASQVRNERIRSARHGSLPEVQQSITFGYVWQQYDQWLSQGRSRPRDERQRYRDHLKGNLENLPISSISPLKLEEIKKKLLDQGYSPATVKHCLIIVRQVINKAVQWGIWSGDNPVKKIKLPQVENKKERFLSREEAQKLIKELGKRSLQTQAIAIVSLETGMRAGEILALRWQDIDYKAGIINVRGKGGYNRQVYLTKQVIVALKRQPQSLSGYVFESRAGGPVKEVSRAFARAVNYLELNKGIEDRKQIVSFHTLRHTFASWLALAGTPLLTIKELLGHKNIDMTMRYAHLCPDHKREAVTRVSGLWSSADNNQENSRDP